MLIRWKISLLLIFSLINVLQAQENKKLLPLTEILQSLETQFDVVFSYANENIEGIRVTKPLEGLTLQETLEYLTEKTNLHFQQLDSRYIAVRRAPKNVICGTLYDKLTNEPIVAATVSTIGSREFAVSNDSGYFEISVQSLPATITIRHVSYSIATISINNMNGCTDVFLKTKVSSLDEVFVSNYLVRGVDKKVTGEFEINTHEIDILPGLSEPDVLYIMQTFPGIQSPNESVSNINIRGGTNDQNLLLYDGVRMYQSSHFYGLITAFNPYFTEDITLIKNGTSASIGNGVSGTIDIRSDDDVASKYSGGGGVNMLSADGYAKIPLSKKTSLNISARRSLADLVATPTYNNYFDRAFRNTEVTAVNSGDTLVRSDENFTFYDLSTRFNYEVSPRDNLGISTLSIYDDLNYQENELVNGEIESKTSSLTQKSLGGSMTYKRRWSSAWNSSLDAYVSSYQLEAINQDIPNNQRLLQGNEILELGAKAGTRFAVSSQLDFYGGGQYTETGITNLEDIDNPDFRSRIKDVMRSLVIFTEGNYSTKSGNTNIRAGIRGNFYLPVNIFLLEPRMAFRQELVRGLALEVLGEFKNQTSTQIIDLQRDFLGIEKRRWVLSNDADIPIIKSKQLSVGLHYDKNALLVSLEGYTKHVDGIITSSQAFQNQFQSLRSAGSYEIRGLDFLLNKRFSNFSTWLSYALAENIYEFPNLSVNTFPNNLDILHNLTLGLSYSSGHFQFSSSANWHSGRPYTPVNEQNPIAGGSISYQPPNSQRLKQYFRVDLSGKYLFKMGEKLRGQFGFSIWNLSNYENTLNTYYQMEDQEMLHEINQQGLFFTPNAMFRVSF